MKNDKNLIKKIRYARSNEELDDSFQEIYDKYNNLIFYISNKIVRNIESAKDIVQETFIKFFNNINKTEFRNLKYWLVTTAKNMSINYIKSSERKMQYDDEIIFNFPSESNHEIPEMLRDLKRVLTAEEVDIIIMHLVFGYTFREIAEEKKVSINVISSKYRRAIKKFKKEMKVND